MTKCSKCDEELEHDFMLEFGLVSKDRVMCEKCKQSMGERIEAALRSGMSPFRDMANYYEEYS